MVTPEQFIDTLRILDIRLATGVPDSLLKEACACMTASFPEKQHLIATNEGSAVGLAIGHYLATARPALVYMQNSGLGNAVNPITSLADPLVYGIPMVLVIGWRGEMLSDGSQLKDEPQHIKQGQVTLAQLDLLGIPFRVIDEEVNEITSVLRELMDTAMSKSCPVALVVRRNSFTSFEAGSPTLKQSLDLTREAAIETIIKVLPPNVPIVSSTGMASRELYELRQQSGEGDEKDFLTVGGMGHASSIATGVAMAKPEQKIVCLDGDGALLMHMGSLTIAADCQNLLHIVINNGVHDSVGGQPTKGDSLDLSEIAKACGFRIAFRASNSGEIRESIESMLAGACSAFLEIQCQQGSRPDLGRPGRSPMECKTSFMHFLSHL